MVKTLSDGNLEREISITDHTLNSYMSVDEAFDMFRNLLSAFGYSVDGLELNHDN
jgi:hypothetical protein